MIFYFTGTGNSKYIAEKIAAGTNDRVADVADCVRSAHYSFELNDGESIGFVVPVYFFGIPMIVAEFLQKLKASASYSYAVLNCGETIGNAEGMLQRIFPVKAVFGVVAVNNYNPIYQMASPAQAKQQLQNTTHELDAIILQINNRRTGNFNKIQGPLPALATFALYPMYKHGRKTRKFTVNSNCTGCGLCERICPRRAIVLQNGKPAWVIPQCELCLGCLNRCPAQAINYGQSASKGRYVNPLTKL